MLKNRIQFYFYSSSFFPERKYRYFLLLDPIYLVEGAAEHLQQNTYRTRLWKAFENITLQTT